MFQFDSRSICMLGGEKMNKAVIIGILALIGAAGVSYTSMDNSSYGNITCTEHFTPKHYFKCVRVDGSIDKVFWTYEAMNAYYVPPREETFIPEVTYVYGNETQTLTVNYK